MKQAFLIGMAGIAIFIGWLIVTAPQRIINDASSCTLKAMDGPYYSRAADALECSKICNALEYDNDLNTKCVERVLTVISLKESMEELQGL